MKKLTLTLLAAVLLGSLPTRAHAAFTLTLVQTGGNVTITGVGTLNTTALTSPSSTTALAGIRTNGSFLINGPTGGGTVTAYAVGATGPASFGTGNTFNPTSGTGVLAGVFGSATNSNIYVPQGYVSGSALSNTSTYAGATFASLGFTPGTYTYSWGTGATADSLVVTGVVPEPSTWALLGAGAGLVGIVTLRRCRAVRA